MTTERISNRRPQPRFPEVDSQQFWEATKRHQLTYQTCNKCRQVVFYPRRHCPSCGSLETSWNVSKGEGVIYTFSVVIQTRHPAFLESGPFAVGYVDLDEGFRILTNIVGVKDPTKDLQCGMRVKVCWEDQPDGGVSLPLFELA